MDDLREIFAGITEHYEMPIRIGSRCEASVFYRVEDLSEKQLNTCAAYVANRISKVCSPILPTVLIDLPGSFTDFANILSRQLAPGGETLEVLGLQQVNGGNGHGSKMKGKNVVLVNDVITTARSCLEAHTRVTMMGANILCWAALIDRTFGPGPVPVVASFTGEPVVLLEGIP